ncbi:MAG: hypothetical protein H7338_10705 [Candidatus Sericytochromatia bacterium]|nr:hypothetical protein [Candidatus Sericytochromatia bacterium]
MSETAAFEMIAEAEELAEQGEAHFEAAFDKVAAALRLEPNNIEGLKLKGILLDLVEHYIEGFVCHSRAVELDPDNVELLLNLADNCLYRQDFEEACRVYQLAQAQLDGQQDAGTATEDGWVELAERRLQCVLDWTEGGDADPKLLKDEFTSMDTLFAHLRELFPVNVQLAVLHGQLLDGRPR